MEEGSGGVKAGVEEVGVHPMSRPATAILVGMPGRPARVGADVRCSGTGRDATTPRVFTDLTWIEFHTMYRWEWIEFHGNVTISAVPLSLKHTESKAY